MCSNVQDSAVADGKKKISKGLVNLSSISVSTRQNTHSRGNLHMFAMG